MLNALLMTLVLALPASDPDQAATWLDRLESDAASERAVAQRWLAANLKLSDFEALREAAAAGGAESNRRLVGVLASSERHFELAALLGVDTSEKVAGIGRESLLELASTWSAATEQLGTRRLKAIEQFGERTTNRFTVEPRAHELGSLLELLTVAGDSGVHLVYDPDLLQSRTAPTIDKRTTTWLTGTPAELLATLGRSYSFGFDAFGLEDSGDMAWVRVCRRLRAGKSSGRSLLVEWTLRVARNGELEEINPSSVEALDARACARALAASGWPAAIMWLEGRWLKRGDEAALAGLRLLASRGMLSPRLRLKAVQAVWLDGARAHDALEETARALGTLGRVSAAGEDLEAPLLDGWQNLKPWERWLRLVALEQRGSSRTTSREQVLSTLRDTKASPSLAYQALRTAASLGYQFDGALSQQRITSLFKIGCEVDEGRELSGLLVRVGVQPSAAIGTASWSVAERLALCEWFFLAGSSESLALAGSLLRKLSLESDLESSPATCVLVSRLREWKRMSTGGALGDWLAALEKEGAGLERLRIHLGLLGGAAADAQAKALLSRAEGLADGAADLQGLAALVNSAQGRQVLALLTVRASASRAPELTLVLDEAVRVLREERLDTQLAAFVADIHLVGWPESWPAAPRLRATSLRVFARRFEP